MYIYIYTYIYILACGILLVFPNQGWNLCPLQWKPRVLTTGSPGKSLPLLFYPAIISFHFRVYSGLNCAVERHLLFLLGRIPPKRIKFWISGLKTSRSTRGSWYSCSRSVELLPRTELYLFVFSWRKMEGEKPLPAEERAAWGSPGSTPLAHRSSCRGPEDRPHASLLSG